MQKNKLQVTLSQSTLNVNVWLVNTMLSALYENIYFFRYAARRAISKPHIKIHSRFRLVVVVVVICSELLELWVCMCVFCHFMDIWQCSIAIHIFWMQMLRRKRAFSVSMWLNVSRKVWNGTLNVQRLKYSNRNHRVRKDFSSPMRAYKVIAEIMNSSRVKHLSNKLHEIMRISSSCALFKRSSQPFLWAWCSFCISFLHNGSQFTSS